MQKKQTTSPRRAGRPSPRSRSLSLVLVTEKPAHGPCSLVASCCAPPPLFVPSPLSLPPVVVVVFCLQRREEEERKQATTKSAFERLERDRHKHRKVRGGGDVGSEAQRRTGRRDDALTFSSAPACVLCGESSLFPSFVPAESSMSQSNDRRWSLARATEFFSGDGKPDMCVRVAVRAGLDVLLYSDRRRVWIPAGWTSAA